MNPEPMNPKPMKRFYSRKLKKIVVMLRAGEYCVSIKGKVLYTILGSCIATCIYDKEKKIGGMNHFLLPSQLHPDELLTSNMGRYGMYAMELLIGELINDLLEKHCPIPDRKCMGLIITHTGHILDYVNARTGYVMCDGRISCQGDPHEILQTIKESGYESCVKCLLRRRLSV